MEQYFFYSPSLGTCTEFRIGSTISFALYIFNNSGIEFAQVWNNLNSNINKWSELKLKSDFAPENLKDFHMYSASINTNDLNTGTYEFCFRLWYENSKGWEYLGPEGKGRNGLIFLSNKVANLSQFEIKDLFDDLNQETTVESSDFSFASEDFKWWRTSFTIPSSNKGKLSEIALGSLKDFLRSVGLERPNAWWLRPRFGFREEKTIISKEFDTQFLLFQNLQGYYSLIIPITTQTCWTALRSSEENSLIMRCINETGDEQKVELSISIGKDPFLLIEKTMKLIITEIFQQEFGEKPEGKSICHQRLGYCTWNAFGTNVSLEGILDALDSLALQEIPIGYFIIDDGWLNQENKLLKSFEADIKKFPEGLKGSIEQIRQKHPGVKVGVWHTLGGYWRGVDPDSELGIKYGPLVLLPEGRIKCDWLSEDAYIISGKKIEEFYKDFYLFLKEAGVEIIKVDHQGIFDNRLIEILRQEEDRKQILAKYRDALIKVTRENFDSPPALIYCMGLIPKHFFDLYSVLPSEEEGLPITRNSEDFFPDEEESHPSHVLENAFNSLLTKFFQGVTPDWDMFKSEHPWGKYHAVARAISGGPIYITDCPRKHNFDIINKLTARRRNRGRYILRSICSPLPTIDSLFVDPEIPDIPPIKIFNLNSTKDEQGDIKEIRVILGAWSQQIDENKKTITNFSLTNIGSLAHLKEKYAVYFSFLNYAKELKSIHETFPVSILGKGCEIATFVPLQSIEKNHLMPTTVTMGCFGLIDKYNCSQPICNTRVTENLSNFASYQVELNAISEKCGFYLKINPSNTEYKLTAEIDGKPIPNESIKEENNLVIMNLIVEGIFQEEIMEEDMSAFIVILKVEFPN